MEIGNWKLGNWGIGHGTQFPNSPIPQFLGYSTWLVLFTLSLVFYQERAFFMDAGFQLFNLINEQKIQVYHYRFVTAVPQVVPFFLMKMGAPLWALAMGFSASYLLFYFAIWHLLVRYLRCDALGWVLLSLMVLITFDGFYHIQSEFNLGLALLLLAFGVVLRNPRLDTAWQWVALLLLIATIGFSHKLSIIFTVFLWVFFWLGKKELRHWRYVLLLGIFILATAIKSAFFTNWYEAAKQAEFATNLQHYFPKLWDIPSNAIFLERCLKYYYLLPLLLGVVSIFYLRKKQWLRLGLVWSFSLGYLLLYNIADPQAQYRFYSEVSYLPLSIFVAVPFFFDVLGNFDAKNKRWLPYVIAAVLLLRLATIAWNHRTVGNQFGWIQQQLDRPGNRFFLQKDQVPMDTVLMEWGVPFSAMHLSALESPDSAETLLILPDFQWFDDKMGREDVFFSPFHKALEKMDLNENYYRLKPGRYEFIK
ncbi:MAG: hypothetical protein K9J37_08060 [Saprospiraceae bacterium]|nr:hypothetical protein [Saprospiraceae bacterium]MCF8249853.1 hypothetical protein [Saprospiraceae bacterium]MCF8279477.1 hypothetical protein [Bacteroidales bacterium]MCF8311713.1 hypothetical protein [Saprospiraceae bacterium]MCF8440280.1 hypothetical protein [Saprospiraceae bacterium]